MWIFHKLIAISCLYIYRAHDRDWTVYFDKPQIQTATLVRYCKSRNVGYNALLMERKCLPSLSYHSTSIGSAFIYRQINFILDHAIFFFQFNEMLKIIMQNLLIEYCTELFSPTAYYVHANIYCSPAICICNFYRERWRCRFIAK